MPGDQRAVLARVLDDLGVLAAKEEHALVHGETALVRPLEDVVVALLAGSRGHPLLNIRRCFFYLQSSLCCLPTLEGVLATRVVVLSTS